MDFDEQDEMLASFVEESQEHLQTIEPDLLEIEGGDGNVNPDIINRVFRAIHSVKGASGFFGLKNIGELSHVMETLLSLLRESKIELNPELMDALLAGVDALRVMVDDVGASESFDIKNELNTLQQLLDNPAGSSKTVTVAEIPGEDILEIPTMYDIPEDEIKIVINKGFNLYSIQLDINKKLMDKVDFPFGLIGKMESVGRFIDAFLDIDGITGLADCLDNNLSFNFLFASLLEEEFIAVALEIPEENIAPVDIEMYREKFKVEEIRSKDTDEVKDAASADQIKPPPEEAVAAPVEKEEAPPETGGTDVEPQKAKQKVVRHVQAEEKIRVGVNFLNDLVNLAGELVLGRNQLTQNTLNLVKEIPALSAVVQHISRITTEMQEKIMHMRMQPVSIIFSKFNRVVRDLSKKLGKEIKLVTIGEEVELDKTIIEALSDPLTHLIRNSVDHGVEMPEDREKSGKVRHGTIELKAYHQAGQVHIEINDDGGGIDGEKIGAKAVEKGIITKQQLDAMDDKERVRLIFRPGFSTAETVTAVSGRGVGMDVVITNIEQLGGIVNIESTVGLGTKMRIVLPLTLAIVSGLVIKADDQTFILPEANIEELVRVKPDEIESRINVIQDAQVLKLRDMLLPLINLGKVLGLHGENGEGFDDRIEPLRILIARHGNSRLGIIVDSLENIEEIVVKPLPRYLKKMKYYSGASIMGNGTVSLILDVGGLVKKANLHDLKETSAVTKEDDSGEGTGEHQTLLLFENNTEERFALPLELITRIEQVPVADIERVKDNRYLQYQGTKYKLIFLEDYLPVTCPERKPEDTLGVIIPKLVKHPMGIVINRVLTTITSNVELDTETIMAPGLFGSAVLEDKITLLPDMYRLFELAAPEWFGDNGSKKDEDEKKPLVLVVDDTPFFRMVESDYLNSVGYDVVLAENGKKALDILEDQEVDAVILDIIMPVMDGWETIKAIRGQERLKNLPVMAVTSLGEGDEDTAQKGLDAGFTEWEGKLNKIRLLEKLKKMMNV